MNKNKSFGQEIIELEQRFKEIDEKIVEKKRKKDEIMKRSKIIAIGIVCLFLGSILSALATRTITDNSDIWPGTNVWQGNVDFKSGSYFNLSKKIYTSNGLVLNASFTNVQTAIYAIDNSTTETYGWVDCAGANITYSVPLKITNYVELRNLKMFQTAGANKTAITNYYYGGSGTSRNKNIYIHDVWINGNGGNQPEWDGAPNWAMENMPNGVYLEYIDNATIDHVTVLDTAGGGIFIERGKNCTISNCKVEDAGRLYEDSGHNYDMWYGTGIWFYNCSNSLYYGNVVNDCYSGGIIVEGHYNAPITYWTNDVTGWGNSVSDTPFNYYFEDARDCILSDSLSESATKTALWGTPAGYNFEPRTQRITINNCKSHNDARTILNSGKDNKFSHVDSYVTSSDGALDYGQNSSYNYCNFYYNGANGINAQNRRLMVSYCNIIDSTTNGIYYHTTGLNQTKNPYADISHNFIHSPGADGINCAMYNTTMSYNTINVTAGDGIEVTGCLFTRIIGNTLNLCTAGNAIIYVNGCNKGDIKDNYIYGGALWGKAIWVAASKRFTISGNTIQQSAANTPYYGINETTASDYNFIVNNYINITTGYYKISRLGANTVVSGNYGNWTCVFPTSAPWKPIAGSCYLNTTTGKLGVYSGSAWYWLDN